MNPIRTAVATVLLFLLAGGARAACVTPPFNEENAPSTFNRHVTADFDNDGFPDIAGLSGTSVLLYQGNGTFTPESPVTLYTGTQLDDIVVADVNADGKKDLVFTDSGARQIGVLFGTTGLSFTGPLLFSTPSLGGRRLATGDFNEDGRLDIFVLFGSSGSLYVQDVNGQFASATNLFFSNTRDIVAGDFNLDGDLDIVANTTGGIAFIPGRGDGTFSPAQNANSGTTSIELAAADLDADGNLDIVSADDADVSVTVWRNIGGWSPLAYPILPPDPLEGTPRVTGLTLADFNGDGFIDIAAGAARAGYIAVLTGNGDATFDPASYTFIDANDNTFTGAGSLRTLSAADLDGDGRVDIVGEQQSDNLMSIFQNVCGLAEVEAEAPPVISVGTTLEVPVAVAAEAEGGITPTGTVTLLNGATVLDSDTLVNGAATLQASALPAGTYSLTVRYSGDSNYDPALSEPIPVTVTTDTTSVSISKSVSSSVWGQPVTFTATVTATNNTEAIEGTVEILIDDTVAGSGNAPVFAFNTSGLTAGTHALQARYLGSETHPPSSSASSSHVVNKAVSELLIRSDPSFAGGSAIIEALINLPYVAYAGGTIRLYEGSTLAGTIDAAPQPRIFTLGSLATGTHYFHAVYTGDANVLGDDSPVVAHTVFAQASGLDARGGSNSITVIWSPLPANATQARLLRSVGTGSFAIIGGFDGNTRMYVDTSVSAGTIYRYMVEYLSSGGGVAGTTNTDLARLTAFTNDGDLTGIPIRAAHFNEIRDAANALRAAAGLSPLTLTFSGVVQAAHVNQLRNAINEARTALNTNPYDWSVTVEPGAPIRAFPIQQLRDAVR